MSDNIRLAFSRRNALKLTAAAGLAGAPILEQLEGLDLSLGNLGDAGGAAARLLALTSSRCRATGPTTAC